MKLPLFNGNDAVFSGVCLDQITVQFPKYPLQGRVEKDIRNGYKQIGGDVKNLPKLPRYVGGNTDFMIGIKVFEKVENAGSELSFRYSKCCSCELCTEHDQSEILSVREEVEQDVINNSVEVNIKNRVTVASLPLMQNPAIKLAPNKNKALQIYNQQIRKLDQNFQDKRDVIESEAKLQKLGFVEIVKNLTPEQQQMLKASDVQNFIPWRTVWNGNSVCTPCCIVFDASQQTPSGTSLNDILAKGKNNMNKLVEIVICWSKHRTGFRTNIKKMYNIVQLRQEDWCLHSVILGIEI